MSQASKEAIREQLREAERKVAFWKKGDPPKFMAELEADVVRLKQLLAKEK